MRYTALYILTVLFLCTGVQTSVPACKQIGSTVSKLVMLPPILRAAILPAQYINNRDECAYPVYVDEDVVLNYYAYYVASSGNVCKTSLDTITRSNKQNATFIIYCNGQGVFSCDENSGTTPYATTLLSTMPDHERMNTYIVRFTYRGTGGSTGSFQHIHDLCEDTRAVFDLLHEHNNIPAEHIILHGHSLGGSVAILTGAQLHNTIPPKRCFVRSDRSFAYMEGVVADKVVPRSWSRMNNSIRSLIRNAISVNDLYPNVYDAWKSIPNDYKDFRVASDDEVIPQSSSLYQAIYEHEGVQLNTKVIPGTHQDPKFIAPAWYHTGTSGSRT